MSRTSSARFLVVALLIGSAAPMLSALPASAAAKKGQLCAKSAAGTQDSGLTCTKDSAGKFRWTAGAAAATPTTKAAKATPTTKAAKATPPTVAAKTSTKSTTKSTSAAATGSATVAKKGQFCKKADTGKTATDASGVKLTCTADAKGGTPHWKAA